MKVKRYVKSNFQNSFHNLVKISSKVNGNPPFKQKKEDLNDIEIKEEDIKEAIEEMDENSAAGPDGIAAILLKKLKRQYHYHQH